MWNYKLKETLCFSSCFWSRLSRQQKANQNNASGDFPPDLFQFTHLTKLHALALAEVLLAPIPLPGNRLSWFPPASCNVSTEGCFWQYCLHKANVVFEEELQFLLRKAILWAFKVPSTPCLLQLPRKGRFMVMKVFNPWPAGVPASCFDYRL